MGRIITLFTLLLLSLGAQAQSFSEAYQAQTKWLPGRIYDVATEKWITPEQLPEQIISADYILLGERHDNADHHQIELWLTGQLYDKGWLQQLSLEMLDQRFQQRLDQLPEQPELSPSSLKQLLHWQSDNKGWPWEAYGPTIYAAAKAGVTIRSANLSRPEIMKIYRAPAEVEPQPLTEAQQELIAEQIRQSHCNKLPATGVTAMVAIQQQRDQTMALSLQQVKQGGLLLAGLYHVRKDLGVPKYLDYGKAVTVGMVEVASADELDSMIKANASRYDYLWLTPAKERPDYCAETD